MPSNTPMTAKIGPSSLPSPSTPPIVTGPPSGTGGYGRRGVDEDLVRREAAVAVAGDRDERPGLVADADRAVAERPAGRLAGPHELAAGDGRDLGRVEDDLRQGLETGVDRQQQAREPLRALRGGRPDVVERRRGVDRERPAGRPDERAEVRRGPDGLAEIAGERPDVGPRGAADVDDRDRPGGIALVPVDGSRASRSSPAARRARPPPRRGPSRTPGGRRP